MNTRTTIPERPRRRLGRSIGAVLLGLIAVMVLSTVTDVVMHASGVFPPWFQPMSTGLWLFALAYRTLYTVLGGYLTARYAPHRPMAHAWTLGLVGTVFGIAGVVATWGRGPEFGPAWYPILVALTGLPGCLIGGLLYARRR
ncbi:hypothetical protein V1318_19210 [Lysobacter sp. CCNWLW3]|uniref:hypothetical protein n=1 Tax=unclassified Lysobacter TaxID=2635362 RepID=UPI002FCEDCCA